MNRILQGIPRICCYIDDILVTGEDDKDHWDNLSRVLSRLEEPGVTVKRSKCHFT